MRVIMIVKQQCCSAPQTTYLLRYNNNYITVHLIKVHSQGISFSQSLCRIYCGHIYFCIYCAAQANQFYRHHIHDYLALPYIRLRYNTHNRLPLSPLRLGCLWCGTQLLLKSHQASELPGPRPSGHESTAILSVQLEVISAVSQSRVKN